MLGEGRRNLVWHSYLCLGFFLTFSNEDARALFTRYALDILDGESAECVLLLERNLVLFLLPVELSSHLLLFRPLFEGLTVDPL